MSKIVRRLPHVLSRAAHTPATARTGDARLAATARTPGGVFSFECTPALNVRRGGVVLTLPGQTSFACSSTDGRATLAVTIFGIGPSSSSRTSETRAQVLLVVPGMDGSPLSYTGPAELRSLEQVNFLRTCRLRGEFGADLGGSVDVRGAFDLVGE